MIQQDEIARRRDFRAITTFTIDPADAKDFDDALSIQQLENGHWEIGVHIADVTHYVRPARAGARGQAPRHLGVPRRPRDSDAARAPEQRPLLAAPQRGQADVFGRV